jgi:putative peptide zinc metalloprotease protein
MVPERSATAAPGIVEAASTEQATARTGARIASAKPAWTRVTAGDPVLTLDNPALLAERDAIAARLRAEDLRAFAALARGETAAAESHASERSTLQDALDRVERDIAELTIRAPFDAVWLPAPAAQSEGRWVRPGDALGRFVQLSDRRIVALVPQGSRALRGGAVRKATLITPSGQTLNAALASVSTVGTRVLPSPALALEAGGSVRTTMPESVGTPLALEPFFRAVLTTPEDVAPPVGQRVWVRFEHPPEPILTQAVRTVRGLLQRRAGGEQ